MSLVHGPRWFQLDSLTRTDMVRVMAHMTSSVEYGLHCLLFLAGREHAPASSADLAAMQGISPTLVAKIFPKLRKAGLVIAMEGIGGGYILARRPEDISVLEVVEAIDGRRRLFECQEIRGRCALFGDTPPDWATRGRCSVHMTMLRAEKAMRESLSRETLADIVAAVGRKAPPEFQGEIDDWFDGRLAARTRSAESGQA